MRCENRDCGRPEAEDIGLADEVLDRGRVVDALDVGRCEVLDGGLDVGCLCERLDEGLERLDEGRELEGEDINC